MKTLYIARVNSDTTEGRGHQLPVAAFTNRQDAEDCAAANEPYGFKGQFTDVNTLILYDHFEEYKSSYGKQHP